MRKRKHFRASLIQAYQHPGATALPHYGVALTCIISGLQLPAPIVIAGHLLSRTEEVVRCHEASHLVDNSDHFPVLCFAFDI